MRNSLFRLSMENLFVSGGAPARESLLVILVIKVRSIRHNITFISLFRYEIIFLVKKFHHIFGIEKTQIFSILNIPCSLIQKFNLFLSKIFYFIENRLNN